MNLGVPIGILVAFGSVLAGVFLLGGDLMDFLDPASAMLVVVPTLAVLFVAFPTKAILMMRKHFPIMMGRQNFDPLHYVNTMVELAEKARSQGLLALENEAGNIEDAFIKNAAMMVADAVEPEVVEERMTAAMDSITERHTAAWAIYDRGAAYAPAFGMCATVVALINMLMGLDFADAGGVAALGINMSAALITTLYGSLVANIIFLPLGTNLRVAHSKEIECKKIVVIAILAIQRGVNPRAVKEMLLERLDPKFAEAAAESGE